MMRKLAAIPLCLLPTSSAFLAAKAPFHRCVPRFATKMEEEIQDNYKSLIGNLATLLEETSEKMKQMKDISLEIEKLEIHDPKVITKMEPKIPNDLAQALAEAKAADDIFGPTSKESNEAWEEAKQISIGNVQEKQHAHHPTYRYRNAAHQSESNHHWYSAIVDPQSLHQAVDAMGKIEHLNRLVTMERNRMQSVPERKESGGLSP